MIWKKENETTKKRFRFSLNQFRVAHSLYSRSVIRIILLNGKWETFRSNRSRASAPYARVTWLTHNADFEDRLGSSIPLSSPTPVSYDIDANRIESLAVLPSEGPRLTASGGRTSYLPGEIVAANCTSAKSKPGAYLNITINDEPVSRFEPTILCLINSVAHTP